MNALATVNQEASLAVRLPASLEAALDVLRSRTSYDDFPVIEPELRQAIPDAVAQLERSLEPASAEQIAAALGTIEVALPMPRGLTERDAEARLVLYIRALHDIPADVLEDACWKAVQTLKFFPKVAELRELAMPELRRRRGSKAMLELLARIHDERYQPPVPESQLAKPEDFARLQKRIGRAHRSRRGAK